ncbi:MAG: electron transport complex subunit RsxB [Pseudomonadales bacterium]|nr:electron transport complex subunit RsxB [Pseudomonadales bacterium]
MSDTDLIPLIDALLPQTQCTKCGYQGCLPYAEAIAAGDAINKCPPGGAAGIAKLAALLERPIVPLDTTRGTEPSEQRVAFIREAECIGCTKCIQACPVDAILGAAKLMHTVVSDICTGCDLCVAPCPVDCIDMIPAAVPHPTEQQQTEKADLSRQRFQRRNARLEKITAEKSARRAAVQPQATQQSAVEAALQLAQEKRLATAQTLLQAPEVLREKLEKTLASAQERLARAEAKVLEAEKHHPEQVAQLSARREDMRFKVNETLKKLAALDKPVAPPSAAAQAALAKMLAARQQKPDSERFASGLKVIEQKLATAREQLHHAQGDEAYFLREDIERLEKKRATVLQEMQAANGGCEKTD